MLGVAPAPPHDRWLPGRGWPSMHAYCTMAEDGRQGGSNAHLAGGHAGGAAGNDCLAAQSGLHDDWFVVIEV